ncbi:TetR family transcriptional regulator [Pseudoduganella flava]|uniref:TetR family transcriptional regulator n=1 Tax=Pseudoduganella flava TaxID=871742 RepID=A0A562PD58_9BURK|nr:TetR/AcrR family transcriptional regulator [Pseudoduganella flava]QGZ42199.1 TetR family transcriptional regulator [Pseudoduganella flava]TWI42415.1 TetR family transcriptional regulator [Pseudoduganella flava]
MARIVAERGDVIPLLAEVFRTHGFEGASLTRLCEGTRLGKGSIYHFFPGGKDEMAAAVLAEIDRWFREQVFEPLRAAGDARQGIAAMFDAVERYFDAGKRVCLVGMFALGNERDRFAARVQGYFAEWIGALTAALVRAGRDVQSAAALAEEAVAGIQGALVLARALDRPAVFSDALARLRERLL